MLPNKSKLSALMAKEGLVITFFRTILNLAFFTSKKKEGEHRTFGIYLAYYSQSELQIVNIFSEKIYDKDDYLELVKIRVTSGLSILLKYHLKSNFYKTTGVETIKLNELEGYGPLNTPPENWITKDQLFDKLNDYPTFMIKKLEEIKESHPEFWGIYIKRQMPRDCFSPEIIPWLKKEIKKELKRQKKEKEKALLETSLRRAKRIAENSSKQTTLRKERKERKARGNESPRRGDEWPSQFVETGENPFKRRPDRRKGYYKPPR